MKTKWHPLNTRKTSAENTKRVYGTVHTILTAPSTGKSLYRRNPLPIWSDWFDRLWDSILTALNKALGYNPYSRSRGEKPIQGLTAHILRHNWCTEMCYQIPKVTTKMIAKMFGDDEKMVLEIYSHIVEEKENPTDAINDAFAV